MPKNSDEETVQGTLSDTESHSDMKSQSDVKFQSNKSSLSVEDQLAFHTAVQKQAEERILRFTETPKINYAVFVKDKNPFDNILYKRVELIAENASTCIEIVEDKSGKKYVRKSKRDSEEVTKLHERGYDFLVSAIHPAFPKAVGFFSGTVDEQLVSTSLREHVAGKNLEEIVKGGGAIETEIALKNMLQILDAVEYAHEKKIFIGDIKPSQFIREEKTGDIKLIDVDSVSNSEKRGTSGTTFGIHSDTWQHPDALTPMAGVSTELFSVGTTFYYLLTSARPEFYVNEKKQYTLTKQKWSVLENKFRNQKGGPELIRTIRALIEPKPSMNFSSAKEAMEDVSRIAQIFKKGYSFKDFSFRRKGKDTVAKVVDKVFDIGEKVPIYTLLGAGLGILGGVLVYNIGTHKVLQEFKTSPVYEKINVENNSSVPPLIQAAEHFFNFINDVERFRLEMSKEESEMPNDITQRQTWEILSDEAKKIANLFEQSEKEMTANYDGTIKRLIEIINREKSRTYSGKFLKENKATYKNAILTELAHIPKGEVFRSSPSFLFGETKDGQHSELKDVLGRKVIDTISYMQGRSELLEVMVGGYNAFLTDKPTEQSESIEFDTLAYIERYTTIIQGISYAQDIFVTFSYAAKKHSDEIYAGLHTTKEDVSEFKKGVLQEYLNFSRTEKIAKESVSHSNYIPLCVALLTVMAGCGVGLFTQLVKRKKAE